ncbi:Ig-like domain-containing protein [Hymenobacter negativus]|uniref:T9SS type A sorting domain-containing protein n=1 Tax=Hymenobacter negativus TaxID=2795026 RepID=A0ABS3QIC4_9BACT|nr:Ig-like domain-containing protein [Hymenobacter negativus]MBO2010991.1 T9SS type A sorting domain-containing protein [Hymenobacter negativus]
MKNSLLLLLLLLLTGGVRAQTVLLTESFETDGEGTRYTSNTFDFRANTNNPPSPNNNGLTQYFVRNTANPVLNPYPAGGASFGANASPITIGNVTGSAFWISESARGTGDISTIIRPPATLTLNPVNTTGYSGLQVKIDLAQGTRPTALQIENDDKINIQYSTNGGLSYTTIGSFVGDNPAANVAGNWRQDANLNGSSVDDVATNSPILSQTLTTFAFGIPVTASSLLVRVEVDQVGATEELAFDKIQVLGTLSATAAPVMANIETAPLPYAEGQAATQVTNTLTVSDADSPNLTGATVQFTSGFVSGQDVLAFTPANGINRSYNATTGILTLTGTASVATYQAALRTVTYQNTNVVTATGGNRLVQFTTTDGVNNSNGATRIVAVAAVLNAAAALPYTEDFTTDGEGLRYSSNQFVSSGNSAFLRTNRNPYDAAGNATTFTNISNAYYWFGENTANGNNPDPLRIGRLVTQQVDASSFSNLHFQIRLGATSVGSRIQTTDYFKLYYRTGGSAGTWTLFGSFRGNNSAAVGNGVMQQDTDPNNPGTVPNGTTLTEALQNFDFTLPAAANGQLVDFRLDLSIDDDPADFAFDLLQVTGTVSPPVVTAPANGSLINTRTPAYSGTAPAGSTVTVFVDGTSIGTTTATGGTFNLTQPTNLTDGSHTVRATATLNGTTSASSNTNTFTVDATSPSVAISSTAGTSGSTTSTSPIPFTVSFSENVTGFVAGDVTITNGTLSGFTAVNGTTYTFNVTPAGNGLVTVNVPANVGQDAAGNGNTAATQFNITYSQPVTAAPVVISPANGSLLTTNTPSYTGTAPAGSIVTVFVDGASIGTTTATGGTFSLTQPTNLSQGSHTVRATAQTSGSAVSPNSNTNTFTVDTVSPTTAISSTAGASGSTTNTSPIPFTVTFSESVTGFVAGDVIITNGTLSGFTSVNGTTYTFTVTPAGNGLVTVNVPANVGQDAAGNGNTAATQFNITYSQPVTAAPVVTAPANGSLISTRTPAYSGTAPAGSTVTVFVDGASIGTTTATGGTFSLTQPTNLTDGSHTVRATAQASGSAVSPNSNTNTFTVDATSPSVVISSTAGASGSTTGTSPIPFTVTFSENVTGFVAGDVTITNGTLAAFTSVNGTTYTFAVTPAGNGAVTVNVPANVGQDAAGNGNTAATQFNITYSQPVTAAPVVISPANGSLLTTSTPVYTGTAPAGSTVTVYIDGTAIGTTTATGVGGFSIAQPTNLSQGSHTVRATAQTSGSAVSPNSNTNTFTVDTVSPTTAISSTATNPTSTSPIPVTVTFSESVTGFVAGDVAITNGTLSGFTAVNSTTYTFNVTPTASGTVTINVAANVSQDAAGNGNTAASQFSIQYNLPGTAAPIVTLPANGSLINTRTPAYSGTAPAGSTVTVYVDGTSIGTTTATGGTFSLTQPTNLADGSHTVFATAQSSGSTVSANSNTNTFVVDATSPSVVISSTAGASGSTTNTAPIPFTVTFSESVTGFVAGDVTITNGTLSGFTAVNGTTYTFSVTPTAVGTVTVNVAANVSQDAAGNGNTAAAQFNIIYALPVTATTWTGLVSNDWFTMGNWTAGVPTSTLDAVIAVSGNGNYPRIGAGTATVRSLTLDAGTTLTQTGGTLASSGNLTNNGTFAATGGTVSLTGSSTQSVGGSSRTSFWNLTVGAAAATLSGAVDVQRLLTLNGNLVTNGQPFTLLSNATATAMVVNNSGVVTGTATVQRYIDPNLNPGLGYRHYSSPVASTTVADLATSTFMPVVNLAYNTVGNTVRPFPTVYGYDESRLNSTNATTQNFDYGYFSPGSLTDPLVRGRGYTVNIDAASKVDLVGSLNSGTVPVGALSRGSEANAGWHLLGNPYPAPLDWNSARTGLPTGVIDAVYVFKSSSQYTGTYQFYQNGFGTLPGGLIGSMQGFFVRVSQPVAAFNFLNAWRSTIYQNPTFNRSTADTRPAVQLELVDAQGTRDAAFVYFEQGATAGLDDHYDAAKLPNTTGLNLASVAAGNSLAVNGLPLIGTAPVTVPLFIGLPATGTYTLHAAQLQNFATGAQPWLRDLQLNTLTDLSLTPDYTFTMNAVNTAPRFELVFGPAQVLSTSAALAAQVAVFPNPARSAVAVELPGNLSRQPVTAALVDALGRVVSQQVLPAGLSTHKLSLTNVATGVYTLRLSTSAGVIVKKLIVE